MFQIGDKVVYPMHGAGIIESVEEKEILGETRKYFVLRLPLKNMKVMLPVDNVQSIGLRDIIQDSVLEEVFNVLKEEGIELQQNWNRRYRNNMEKVKSGDIFEVAMVVRDLMHMDREKGLSTGERKMLNNTKQILVSELVLVTEQNEKEVETMIEASVH
ncbi:MAG: CarD family transcriptional regulator [Erysipelotrichaceae bacterium]|nr:CarD family transcriptional regulator [Erysipelotrichaceae bacterium]